MKRSKVGILGGMGPEATILLQQRLLDATVAFDDSDHLPLLIDMNPQVPSRLQWFLKGSGEDPGPILASMAQGLQDAGADVLTMPCNTAHYFAPQIEKAVGIPLLNMPSLAAHDITQMVGIGSKIGILASPATNRIGLFRNIFSAYGCSAVYPTAQDEVLDAIKSIKANGPSEASVHLLQRAADYLAHNEVKCIVVGCSEFSLVKDQIKAPVPIVDTLDVLVNYIVAFDNQG
jgi:aspartate racemase